LKALDEDRQALERARGGDVEAFGQLVSKYQDRIVNILYRFTRDYEDAVDLAQETFIRAFRGLEKFKGTSTFFTWLYRIALNQALSHTRSRKSRPPAREFSEAEEKRGIAEAASDPASNPVRTVEQRELHRLIGDALSRLDEPLREAIILRDIEGLSYEEISEILSVSLGAVKTRIHRARMRLRKELAGFNEV